MSETCEVCGRCMSDPACKCDRDESHYDIEIAKQDIRLLRRFAKYGEYGAATKESEQSLLSAEETLRVRFGNDFSHDRKRAIEGDKWWFIEKILIGQIGIIVEKENNRIFTLGSGLIGMRTDKTLFHKWACIDEYLRGNVLPDTGTPA